MSSLANYIHDNKTALFDWLVFSISLSLGFIFPTLRDFAVSPGFSYWMLSALLLYIAGAWLKHLPLSCRLNKSGNVRKGIPYAIFLMIGHWCIFLVVVLFSIAAAGKIAGMLLVNEATTTNMGVVFSSILISAFVTWLVFRDKSPAKTSARFSAQYLFRRELFADIFLITGVSILSFVFWEKGIIAMLSSRPAATISEIWFLFVFLAVTYMFCYLPLRYLFLLEDHFRSRTWKRMLFIFAMLLIRSILEMINI